MVKCQDLIEYYTTNRLRKADLVDVIVSREIEKSVETKRLLSKYSKLYKLKKV